jgi:hypothetical protein
LPASPPSRHRPRRRPPLISVSLRQMSPQPAGRRWPSDARTRSWPVASPRSRKRRSPRPARTAPLRRFAAPTGVAPAPERAAAGVNPRTAALPRPRPFEPISVAANAPPALGLAPTRTRATPDPPARTTAGAPAARTGVVRAKLAGAPPARTAPPARPTAARRDASRAARTALAPAATIPTTRPPAAPDPTPTRAPPPAGPSAVGVDARRVPDQATGPPPARAAPLRRGARPLPGAPAALAHGGPSTTSTTPPRCGALSPATGCAVPISSPPSPRAGSPSCAARRLGAQRTFSPTRRPLRSVAARATLARKTPVSYTHLTLPTN